MRNAIVILLLSLFYISCKSLLLKEPVYSKHPSTPYQPIDNEYKLRNEPFKFNDIIDTTAIYVARQELYSDGAAYFLLRFSNNGTCYKIDNNPKMFNVFDYNGFAKGQLCRYTFEKDNVIKLEFYDYGYKTFMYWFGKVDSEKIWFKFQSKRSGQKSKNRISSTDYIYYRRDASITTELQIPKN